MLTFSDDLDTNVRYLQKTFEDCADVIFRYQRIGAQKTCMIYTEGMVDTKLLSELMTQLQSKEGLDFLYPDNQQTGLWREALPLGQVSVVKQIAETIPALLAGQLLIIVDQLPQGLLVGLTGWEHRGINPPETEQTIRGPKEAFIESLTVNLTLIRRRLLHPDLKTKVFTLGCYSRTRVAVVYLDSIVRKPVLEEVLLRLKKIHTDSILDANYIDEFIEDALSSPFPTILATERPDTTVASLLEGHIAIMQENSPFVLIAPAFFVNFFQSADDYYNHYLIGSLLRHLRLLGIFVTTFMPALYVAATTFNPEMLPTKFLTSIAIQREGIPVPASLEALLMGVAFEVLREAGTRLPRSVGQAVSIVGALIIGEAAVTAGIVSPAMVIVTALTAISSFTMPLPQMNSPLLVTRLVLVLFSSFLGFWGIFIGIILIVSHLVSLRSFGLPYMSPIAPLDFKALQDVFIRAPITFYNQRPRTATKRNRRRQRQTAN